MKLPADEHPPFQGHSPTSRAAAEAMKPHAAGGRERVFATIRATLDGLTDEQGCDVTSMNPSTYRPRRIELTDSGLVVDSGRTQETRSGNRAVVWTVSEKVSTESTKLPVFDTSFANCSTCELDAQCQAQKLCYAYQPPKNFNGLMLIGEGPGQHEVLQGRPFVGKSGQLLRALLESAGLNMDECWITNATLGRPPVMKDKKGFHEQYPNAISSCLSRLEAEIAACKPRVIVTLGAAALIAMTGRDKVGVRREAFDCSRCNNTHKVGPVLQCAAPVAYEDDNGPTGTAGPCHHLHFIEGVTVEARADSVAALKLHGCKACGARLKNVRSKMVKCPSCGGRKMRDIEIHSFVHDYNLSQVAGAIFEPAAGAEERRAHEIDHWFHEQGVRYLVPTYHPAFLLRDQQFMAKAVQKHLSKARRLLTEDAPWPVEYEVTRDVATLRGYVAVQAGSTVPVFTVDIETESIRETAEGPVRGDARDPYQVTEIKVVGIHRQGAEHALVVDTRGVQIMSGDDDLLNALQDFLENPNIPKCYHNGLYDMPCFVHLWGFDWEKLNTGYADDTLGAHAALYPDEPHDLGHVTFSFTDSRAWKPERRVKGQAVHENFDELAVYNARDIWNTNAVRESMGAEGGKAVPGGKLHRAGLSKVYAVDSELRKVAFEMQMVGMPVNRDAREEAAKKARGLRDAAMKRCREAVAVAKFEGEFNPFSWKDLQKALFDTKNGFGLPILKQTKTGASSDEGTIYKLLGQAKDEPVVAFLRALLDVREHHKVLSTYVESDKLAPRIDGRIHANWKPWGARTGRFSSSPNMQNIPIWLRHIFEAPPGRVLVGADGDQIELRIIGALSGDKELIRRCMEADEKRKLEPDCDPHSFVAAIAFGGQYTNLLLADPTHDKKLAEIGDCKCQTCRRKALRDLEKRVIYGGNYGGGAKKIHEVILQSLGADYKGPPITVEMVAHIQNTIDKKCFPDIAPWREHAYAEARANQEIRSPFHNRRRIFPLGDVPFTEAVNYPIQSMAADIINDATVEIYYELASIDPTAYFIAQMHDALYIEAAEDKGEAVGRLLEKHMTCEHVLQPGVPAMRFTASAKVGRKMAG